MRANTVCERGEWTLVERGDDMSEGEFRAPMEAVMTVDIGGDSNEGV